MPSAFCRFCKTKIFARAKNYRQYGKGYIPICYSCRHSKPIPSGFRCKAIIQSTGRQCNSWNKYNEGKKYCRVHEGENNE